MIITANEARARMQTEAYIDHNLDLIQSMIDNAIAIGHDNVVYTTSRLVAHKLVPILEAKGYTVSSNVELLRIEW